MPNIHISDKSLQRLKAWAEPLEDTADSAFTKVLDAAERHRGAKSQEHHGPAARPTLRNVRKPAVAAGLRAAGLKHAKLPQKEFREPLLQAIYELGGSVHVHDLRPVLRERMDARLCPGDFERVSGGAERWWNAICWERSVLVKEGYLRNDSPRGIWALSDKGTELVESRLPKESGNFADHLRSMPDVGEDSDFDRSPS